MLSSTTRFETENASRYLQQLCKHFAHKVEATFDPQTGQVAFAMGRAAFSADATCLAIEVRAADPAALETIQGIIDDHLIRFAFREGLKALDWSRSASS